VIGKHDVLCLDRTIGDNQPLLVKQPCVGGTRFVAIAQANVNQGRDSVGKDEVFGVELEKLAAVSNDVHGFLAVPFVTPKHEGKGKSLDGIP